jgi:hypothetical protein
MLHEIEVIEAFKRGVIMKEKMSRAGYDQGDMKPTVESYQKPEKDFAERGFNKTTEYVERQDKRQSGMCKDLNKQAYQGRYS